MTNRKLYDEKLSALNRSLIEMEKVVEELIEQTIDALITGDEGLARTTIKQDDIIDFKQLYIEKECARLIAQEQPIASDLHFILSVVKIVTDIERIADQCSDICQYSIKLQDKTWSSQINYQRHIERMAVMTKEMLTKALDSLVEKNVETIREICRSDDQIDDCFRKVWQELSEEMTRDSQFIQSGMHYIMIIKYLERIADHTTNIAEWIYYSLTGDYIIHVIDEKS